MDNVAPWALDKPLHLGVSGRECAGSCAPGGVPTGVRCPGARGARCAGGSPGTGAAALRLGGGEGGGDGWLRQVAQPRGRRETTESLARLQLLRFGKLQEKKNVWPLQRESTAPYGLGMGSEMPWCQPNGHLSFPRKT